MNQAESSVKTYSIGQLAEEFDVTSRALRLYEEEGLLDPLREGTRRIYSERNRIRLRLILRGKRLGWSLQEIREIFDMYDSGPGEEAQLEVMLAKLAQRRETLLEQKKDIDHALEDLDRITTNANEALRDIRQGKRRAHHG